jgi:hypothetical protein
MFGDLIEAGIRYAIGGAATVTISDEVLRYTANRLHSKVLEGDPTAVVLWNQLIARAAEHVRQEYMALVNSDF